VSSAQRSKVTVHVNAFIVKTSNGRFAAAHLQTEIKVKTCDQLSSVQFVVNSNYPGERKPSVSVFAPGEFGYKLWNQM
jgi:hypothetical protein